MCRESSPSICTIPPTQRFHSKKEFPGPERQDRSSGTALHVADPALIPRSTQCPQNYWVQTQSPQSTIVMAQVNPGTAKPKYQHLTFWHLQLYIGLTSTRLALKGFGDPMYPLGGPYPCHPPHLKFRIFLQKIKVQSCLPDISFNKRDAEFGQHGGSGVDVCITDNIHHLTLHTCI